MCKAWVTSRHKMQQAASRTCDPHPALGFWRAREGGTWSEEEAAAARRGDWLAGGPGIH